MGMKPNGLQRFDAIVRLSLLSIALSAIGWGVASIWGIGAAAIVIGALFWVDLNLPGNRDGRNKSDSS